MQIGKSLHICRVVADFHIAAGSTDVGIKLITTPAEREAYNKLSDTDLATIKRVSDRLSKNYNDKGGRL